MIDVLEACRMERKMHQVVKLGTTIIIEKISYKAWQKQFGRYCQLGNVAEQCARITA
jgi:hypothetical protein